MPVQPKLNDLSTTKKKPSLFRRFAVSTSNAVGTSKAFVAAILFISLWIITGPVFGYTDTWQLVINTITTIITFLMVFLIQNTQNRDSKAIHIKLDELIKGIKGARNVMINLEELPDDELENLHVQFRGLHEKYNSEMIKRQKKKRLVKK